MELLSLVGLFFLGLIFGSFLNVIISRSPSFLQGRGISVFGGRSHCDHCQRQLQWFELLPVISFLVLWGKCRTCRNRIPLQYAIVEVSTAIVFLGVGYRVLTDSAFFIGWPLLLHTAFSLLGVFSLLGIFFFDFLHMVIPDIFSGLFLSASIGETVLRFLYLGDTNIRSVMVAAAGVLILFGGIWFVTKGVGMGFGDVKLAPLIPIFLGAFPGIIAILLSFWIGALFSVILLFSKKRSLKDEIPFAPFLVLGCFLVLFFPHIVFWFDFLRGDILFS